MSNKKSSPKIEKFGLQMTSLRKKERKSTEKEEIFANYTSMKPVFRIYKEFSKQQRDNINFKMIEGTSWQ